MRAIWTRKTEYIFAKADNSNGQGRMWMSLLSVRFNGSSSINDSLNKLPRKRDDSVAVFAP